MEILYLDQIKKVLPDLDLIPDIEKGFVDYSRGLVVVPPVGEMIMEKGEVHIKYGFIRGGDHYVIKVASGFYKNHLIGIPSGNGLMLLFDQNTGTLLCALLDEGHLTDIRTAIAGAIAAKHLAPENIRKIGVLGAGVQARLQLEYLKKVTSCRDILVWGRNRKELELYKKDMTAKGFNVETTEVTSNIEEQCNLIITATPSKTALLQGDNLMPGSHITAIGSDTPEKQELHSSILKKADVIVADSIPQCMLRGEIYQAIKAGSVKKDKVVELGNVIAGSAKGRTSQKQLSVADLTGVAVQDIKIASAVYKEVKNM
jgi:ornithine cyclodeaminase